MTPEQMLEQWATGSYDDCRIRRQITSCDMVGWEYEEEGDFVQDCKYQHADHIIKHVESGRCFRVYESRSGSPFTDWYYSYDIEPEEVKKVTVTKTITVDEWHNV